MGSCTSACCIPWGSSHPLGQHHQLPFAKDILWPASFARNPYFAPNSTSFSQWFVTQEAESTPLLNVLWYFCFWKAKVGPRHFEEHHHHSCAFLIVELSLMKPYSALQPPMGASYQVLYIAQFAEISPLTAWSDLQPSLVLGPWTSHKIFLSSPVWRRVCRSEPPAGLLGPPTPVGAWALALS